MAKSVLHDDAMVQLLKDSPDFAPVYLHQAFIEIDEPGGYEAFMLALRHVIEASGGMTVIAKRAGISREALYHSHQTVTPHLSVSQKWHLQRDIRFLELQQQG